MKLQQRLALLMTAAVAMTAMTTYAQNHENTMILKQVDANWEMSISGAVPVYEKVVLEDIILKEGVAGLLAEEDEAKRTFTFSLEGTEYVFNELGKVSYSAEFPEGCGDAHVKEVKNNPQIIKWVLPKAPHGQTTPGILRVTGMGIIRKTGCDAYEAKDVMMTVKNDGDGVEASLKVANVVPQSVALSINDEECGDLLTDRYQIRTIKLGEDKPNGFRQGEVFKFELENGFIQEDCLNEWNTQCGGLLKMNESNKDTEGRITAFNLEVVSTNNQEVDLYEIPLSVGTYDKKIGENVQLKMTNEQGVMQKITLGWSATPYELESNTIVLKKGQTTTSGVIKLTSTSKQGFQNRTTVAIYVPVFEEVKAVSMPMVQAKGAMTIGDVTTSIVRDENIAQDYYVVTIPVTSDSAEKDELIISNFMFGASLTMQTGEYAGKVEVGVINGIDGVQKTVLPLEQLVKVEEADQDVNGPLLAVLRVRDAQNVLTPFAVSNYEHSMKVSYTTEDIVIEALPTEEGSIKIQGAGKQTLVVGKNTFKVTAKKGSQTVTYTLTIEREPKVDAPGTDNGNNNTQSKPSGGNGGGGSSKPATTNNQAVAVTYETVKDKITNLSTDKRTEMKKQLEEKVPYTSLNTVMTVKQLDTSSNFKDVSEKHWVKESVDRLAKLGVFTGVTEESFKPNEALKVSDTFTALDRVLLLMDVNDMKLDRSTVEKYMTDSSHWAFANMASIGSKLNEATLKEVVAVGEDKLSRGLLAQVLFEVTAGKLEVNADTTEFKDVTGSPYEAALNYCKQTGLLIGTGDNKVAAEKAITRAELAVILERVMTQLERA